MADGGRKEEPQRKQNGKRLVMGIRKAAGERNSYRYQI